VRKTKRLFVEVLGGNVVGVYADSKIKAEVVIVDWDNISQDPECDKDAMEKSFDEVRANLVELPLKGIDAIPPKASPAAAPQPNQEP